MTSPWPLYPSCILPVFFLYPPYKLGCLLIPFSLYSKRDHFPDAPETPPVQQAVYLEPSLRDFTVCFRLRRGPGTCLSHPVTLAKISFQGVQAVLVSLAGFPQPSYNELRVEMLETLFLSPQYRRN